MVLHDEYADFGTCLEGLRENPQSCNYQAHIIRAAKKRKDFNSERSSFQKFLKKNFPSYLHNGFVEEIKIQKKCKIK